MTGAGILVLVVIGALIVGVHEGGQATAARALRFDDVKVQWFPPGTSYSGTGRWGRVALVSLAGPAANGLLGLAAWAATVAVGDAGAAGWLGLGAFRSVLFGASNPVPVPGRAGWVLIGALARALRR